MTEMLGIEEIKKITKELADLYVKAKTREEYENLMNLSRRCADKLQAHMVFLSAIIIAVFPGYWAEYHLFDKFPAGFTKEDINKFAEKIKAIRLRLTENDLECKVALLYLESNIWSHLLFDQEKARWCVEEMEKIISKGKVSTASVLKMINSAGNKEMDAGNYFRAVGIFNRINKFSQEELEKPENLLYTANIINQLGAAKIRGNINIKEGLEDLTTALSCYLKLEPVPVKHLGGIANRLKEATRKL